MESNFLLIFLMAILLDLVLGELPFKLHPVVWMGNLIHFLKPSFKKIPKKFSGLILSLVVIIIFIVPIYLLLNYLKFNLIIYFLISSVLLTTTFSIKLLICSARQVNEDLNLDINKARHSISLLVSRDTEFFSKEEIISATIETLTENITDSVIAPLLFFFILGVPGAFLYRIVNTLDSMVGYQDQEHSLIGWFPAKLDDILNYIPARLAGLLIVIAALILGFNWKKSFTIMLKDAKKTPSPNSGYTMAAAAGALEIKLEKPEVYVLGENKENLTEDSINKALKLSKMSIFLFIVFSMIIYILFSLYMGTIPIIYLFL